MRLRSIRCLVIVVKCCDDGALRLFAWQGRSCPHANPEPSIATIQTSRYRIHFDHAELWKRTYQDLVDTPTAYITIFAENIEALITQCGFSSIDVFSFGASGCVFCSSQPCPRDHHRRDTGIYSSHRAVDQVMLSGSVQIFVSVIRSLNKTVKDAVFVTRHTDVGQVEGSLVVCDHCDDPIYDHICKDSDVFLYTRSATDRDHLLFGFWDQVMKARK